MYKCAKTILFVDDDEDLLRYVAESMQSFGYRVFTKTNGPAALSFLDEGAKVDLVITDYVMPEMDGLEFMAEVRKRTQSLPILLLTANADVETYFRALKLGAYEVTSKPISVSILHSMIKTAFASLATGGNNIATGMNNYKHVNIEKYQL